MSSAPVTISSPAAPSFFGLSHAALARRMEAAGEPPYRADQLYAWVYRRHQRDPAAMTDLPSALRSELPRRLDFALPPPVAVHATPDGLTHKFVLELADGARVECVSMRSERRTTLCLSAQVGCALKCSFCATGLMGFERNLRPEEIVAQVPVNRRWPLAELIPAARDYGRTTGRRVTLEYTLIAGVNDRLEDADRLGTIARDLPSKINLIPYNPVPGLPYHRPGPEAVE